LPDFSARVDFYDNTGTLFWETRVWTWLGLETVFPFNCIPNLPLNETLMCLAACGLLINIIHACLNVYASRADSSTIRSHTRETNPLILLLPFLFPIAIQIAWLSHPAFNHSAIVHSPLLVPFLCAWGIQFAHQVGRMILAHVTLGSEPFPCWDWVWVWNGVGALDANFPRLLGRAPIIQTNTLNTALLVFVTLGVSGVSYARFVRFVVKDITEFVGFACLRVMKKDGNGNWVRMRKDES